MPRLPWIVVALLGAVHLALSTYVAARSARSPTYVFTPLVDVVPGGVPLTGEEASQLTADAKNKVDARDIQKAYARMGSNVSLNDLLDGFTYIEPTLSEAQRTAIAGVLTRAQEQHRAVYAVQGEILTLEADIDRQVTSILATLPADTRARVDARGRRR